MTGEVDSMAGKRKSPERETVDAVPDTPSEVRAVGQLISVPASGAGGQAGGQAEGQAGVCQADAQCLQLPGVLGYPKDGPVMALPWKIQHVSIQKWKDSGYRKQNNGLLNPFNIGYQKIPQNEVQEMYFPEVYLSMEQKQKIETKMDLIAKGIHPRYQEAMRAYERVQKSFQEIIATCNKCGIKQGEMEEFINYVAKNKEDAERLGIK
tara:strand:- start:582 stop:1205 length:624 start_codon:yes stop_codon:yes gene_type:complete